MQRFLNRRTGCFRDGLSNLIRGPFASPRVAISLVGDERHTSRLHNMPRWRARA